MSKRLPPRKRARFRRQFHKARDRVYKQAKLEVQRTLLKERAFVLAAIKSSSTPEEAKHKLEKALPEAHKAANWRRLLRRLHQHAAEEGERVTLEVLGDGHSSMGRD